MAFVVALALLSLGVSFPHDNIQIGSKDTENDSWPNVPDDEFAPTPWYWAGLDCDRRILCNGEMCMDVCEPGTVRVDPWLKVALSTQRSLQRDRPLFLTDLPGTHNSAISLAYGMGIEAASMATLLSEPYPDAHQVAIANQRISLTDQLNLGVRHVELDIHKYDKLRDVRVCHWETPPSAVAEMMAAYEDAYGPLDYDIANIGCEDHQKPLFAELLGEVRAWLELPGNENEFVIVLLDNRAYDNYDEVLSVIEEVVGDVLYRPADCAACDKENPTAFWRTESEEDLVARGFRLLLENNRDSWFDDPQTASYFFPTSWMQFHPHRFSAHPICLIDDVSPVDTRNSLKWNTDAPNVPHVMFRGLDGSLTIGPAYEGRKDYFPLDIAHMLECGVQLQAVDQLNPDMARTFVWSWSDGILPEEGECAALARGNGRWYGRDCDEKLHVAVCRKVATSRSSKNAEEWTITTERVRYHEVLCPEGYEFDIPRNAQENLSVAELLRSTTQQSYAWLKLEI
eukprot:Rmarinus@m.9399